uniref:Uncharacterized protein AlNc14C263G9844 n=1 Tax=Albugo laibachii Nc14 TaxID=890382 RepID=F0WU21_9STRA|nr:conserved hypothetical protein [Albugo laibachii Nc14]CCA24950.1 conserved hypothetical protein [Albugo laibachii Nc14]|eukprot:CCA24950.1 conserved hypothetical protein [Albugo laibachii Nc14]
MRQQRNSYREGLPSKHGFCQMDFASDNSLEECVIGVLSKQLKESPSGSGIAQYEDPDFNQTTIPLASMKNRSQMSLNNKETEPVQWYRPQAFTDAPEYFKSSAECGVVRVGDINDSWLLGVFAAIAMHPDNLIESLFASESLQSFKQYGIFTCRFYKNAEWVYVTTDTRIPYSLSLASDQMVSKSHSGHILFGSSLDKNEMFIPFLEKAYAKLHGSYQSLHASDAIKTNVSSVGTQSNSTSASSSFHTSVRILEAFVDCTGGSAYRIELQDERFRAIDPDGSLLWKKVQRLLKKKAILTTQFKQVALQNTISVTETASGILKNRQYVVLYTKEIGLPEASNVLRFVKLKNVWGRGSWKGDWGPDDIKWDEYAQVEANFRNDSQCDIQRSKSGQDGFFWMIWEDFLQAFNELFCVNVFPEHDTMYQYVIPGEWIGTSAAGGPSKSLAALANRASSPTSSLEKQGEVSDQLQGKKYRPTEHLIEKTKWCWISESEPSWHRNPQFRLTAGEKTSNVIISLLQQDCRLFGGESVAIHFVLERLQPSQRTISYDYPRGAIASEAHTNDMVDALITGSIASSSQQLGPGTNVVGTTAVSRNHPDREIVREEITLEANASYHLIAYTDSPKIEIKFFLRIFSPKPLRVERIPPMLTRIQHGRWRQDPEPTEVDEISNRCSGGPLCHNLTMVTRNPRVGQPSETSKEVIPATELYHTGISGENLAWCKNPQFWVYIDEASIEAEQRERLTHVTLKFVLWKTSHNKSSANTKHRAHRTGLQNGRTTSHNTAESRTTSEKSNMIGITAVRVRTKVVDACDLGFDGESLGLLIKKETAVAGTPALVHYKNKHRQSPRALQSPSNRKALPKTRFRSMHKGGVLRGSKAKQAFSHCQVVSSDTIEDKGHASNEKFPSDFPSPKLIVEAEEWCRVSSYHSPVWSCLFLKKIPVEWLLHPYKRSDKAESKQSRSKTSHRSYGGFFIVPSTGESEVEGTFELQVDSTVPIQCYQLPQHSYQNFVGEWTKSNAKGCHLHAEEWQSNPKFFLTIKSVRPARVRITLTRSELEWRRKCKQDAVGTMIGFYVFPSPNRMHRVGGTFQNTGPKIPAMVHVEGRPWSETDFLPLHSVISPPSLTLTSTITDPYVIMPATYAPEKFGQFVLSVQCDADFTLISEEQFTNL